MRKLTTTALDSSFPTVVRYVGLGIMLYATLIDKVERPSLIVAATGMMLFKTVLGDRGNGGSKDDDHEEKWSHLP